ncbi:MAG: hypothetical protein CSA34_07745 [Desulfobulbus propionicus]|nr:MAG: hypothetical protein CSA34_07745 [Desulfobulbus propionicus]
MKRIYLIRHAPTSAAAGVLLGATDLDVDPARLHLADRLVDQLPARARVLCSPLRRARQTCERLGLGGSGQVEYTDDLREIDFGHWEERSFADISGKDPEAVARWSADPQGFCFPGGESIRAFTARIQRCCAALEGGGEDDIILVSHGGPLRALIAAMLRLPSEASLLFQVKHCRLGIVHLHDQGGVLVGLNL